MPKQTLYMPISTRTITLMKGGMLQKHIKPPRMLERLLRWGVNWPEWKQVSIDIGHFVMDHNTTPDKSDDVKEAEAKFFAKYAKAPMPLIHLLPIVTTETIQKAFGLSREAAKYALDNYWKWLDRFNGTYTDYEQKILSLKRDGLNAYIEELKIQKERSSVRYQRAEGQKYKPNLARKPRGQAVPLQDCNSTVVQRNLYEVRQMAGP